MEIKQTYRTQYFRPIENLRFGQSKADKPIVELNNFIAKKIKICPQTTAREAMSLGLVELARIANVDLSKVVLTEDGSADKSHGQPSYPDENKSQDKKSVEAG